MSLKDSLKAQIVALGWTGAIFYGAIPDGIDEAILIREELVHNIDLTLNRIYPTIGIFIRTKTQAGAETIARAIYEHFHTLAPLTLSNGFRVNRSATDGLPRDLGKDSADLWRRQIDLQLTLTKTATL